MKLQGSGDRAVVSLRRHTTAGHSQAYLASLQVVLSLLRRCRDLKQLHAQRGARARRVVERSVGTGQRG